LALALALALALTLKLIPNSKFQIRLEVNLNNGIPVVKSKDAAEAAEKKRLQQAARQFEAMFLNQMLQIMRKSGSIINEDEKDGMGLGWDNPYQELFDWQLALRLSESRPLGIADALKRHYERQISEAQPLEPQPAKPLPRLNSRAGVPYLKEDVALNSIVARAAEHHQVDPALIKAVITVESGGNSKAISNKGAKGLMQLMDSTAAEVGVRNPFDVRQNINGGTAYLRRMLDRYQGNTRLALAAYNAGPGAVDRYAGVPPYKETTAYVNKVLEAYRREQASAKHNNSTELSELPSVNPSRLTVEHLMAADHSGLAVEKGNTRPAEPASGSTGN